MKRARPVIVHFPTRCVAKPADGENVTHRDQFWGGSLRVAFGRDQQIYLGRSDKDSSIKFERNIVYHDEGKLFVRESRLEAD